MYRFRPAPYRLEVDWGTWQLIYEGDDEDCWLQRAGFWAARCDVRMQAWDNLDWREQMAIRWADLEAYIRAGAPRHWPRRSAWTPWVTPNDIHIPRPSDAMFD